MIKTRCTCKSFKGENAAPEMENFINEYYEKYQVREIAQNSLDNQIIVTITYDYEEITDEVNPLEEYLKKAYDKQFISINHMQTEMGIGFNHASSLIKKLEDLKIVSVKRGTEGRKFLVSYEEACRLLESK